MLSFEPFYEFSETIWNLWHLTISVLLGKQHVKILERLTPKQRKDLFFYWRIRNIEMVSGPNASIDKKLNYLELAIPVRRINRSPIFHNEYKIMKRHGSKCVSETLYMCKTGWEPPTIRNPCLICHQQSICWYTFQITKRVNPFQIHISLLTLIFMSWNYTRFMTWHRPTV